MNEGEEDIDDMVQYSPAPSEGFSTDEDEEARVQEELMVAQAIRASERHPQPQQVAGTSRPSSSASAGNPLNESHSLDEGKTCSICYDNYSAEGAHRCSCLPCGHVFGLKCIKKWLTAPNNRSCPTCKQTSKTKDVIPLFLKCNAQATDSGEVDEVKAQLAAANDRLARSEETNVKANRRISRLERDLHVAQEANRQIRVDRRRGASHDMYDEPPTVRRRLRSSNRRGELGNDGTAAGPSHARRSNVLELLNGSVFDDGVSPDTLQELVRHPPPTRNAPPAVITLDETTPVVVLGNSLDEVHAPVVARGPTLVNVPPPSRRWRMRQSCAPIGIAVATSAASSVVMSYSSYVSTFVVACALPPPFNGFGYKKIQIPPPLLANAVPPSVRLHAQHIKAMCTSPHNTGYVLTGSADRTVVETSIVTAGVIMTIRTPSVVWSVAYNQELTPSSSVRRYVYVGGGDGVTRVYDCVTLRDAANATHVGDLTTADVEMRRTHLHGPVVDLIAVSEFGVGDERKTDVKGVIVMRLTSVLLFTDTQGGDYASHFLIDVCRPKAIAFEPKSGLLMVTLNPMDDPTCVVHEVHKLEFVHHNGRDVYTTSRISFFKRPSPQRTLIRTSLTPMSFGGERRSVVGVVFEESRRKLLAFDAESGDEIAERTIGMPSTASAYQVMAYAENRCAVLANGRVTLVDLEAAP